MPAINIDDNQSRLKSLLKDEQQWGKYWKVYKIAKNEGVSSEKAQARAMEHILAENFSAKASLNSVAGQEHAGDLTLEELEVLNDLADGKNKNARDVIDWIYNNMGNKNVSPSCAPTIGAYSHLKKIQADPVLQAEFYKNIWPKILPKTDVMDELMARLSDDGTKVFNVIDKALEALSKK
jgi:hypothetical protein